MSKAEKGHAEFHGSGETILAEYLAITRGIIDIHERHLGDRTAARKATLMIVNRFIEDFEKDDPLKRTINMNELLVDDDGEIKEFNFYGYGLEDVESITRL